MKRFLLTALLATFLAACVGTEITDPNSAPSGEGGMGGGGGTGGMGGGGTGGEGGGEAPAPLVPTPDFLDLGTTCPGGMARSWLLVENRANEAMTVRARRDDERLEIEPSDFGLQAGWGRRLAVAYRATDLAPGLYQGVLDFVWALPGNADAGAPVSWAVEVEASDMGRSRVLCELRSTREGPCDWLDVTGIWQSSIRRSVTITNDGCGPITLVGIEILDLPNAEIRGAELPAVLQPGDRFVAELEFDTRQNAEGSLVVLTDEAEPPQPIPVIIERSEEQSP